jgi:hypothetical protein
MSYRKSGQTKPRQSKPKSPAYYIKMLLTMRETLTAELCDALETANDTERGRVERAISDVDTALVAHRANMARQTAQRGVAR